MDNKIMENTKKKKYVPTYFKDYCKNADQGYLTIELEKCVTDKKLHYLKYMLTTNDFKLPNLGIYSRQKDTTFDVLAKSAAQYKQYDVLHYLLESPDLKKNADINKVLIDVIEHENLEVALYLLTSDQLTKHADINLIYKNWRDGKETNFLIYAVRQRDYQLIELLTVSPLLKEHIDIHALDNKALYNAFLKEDLNTIKFLLTDNRLKSHPLIDRGCTMILLMSENKEILDFLANHNKLQKNEIIQEFIDSSRKHNETLMLESPDIAQEVIIYLDYLDNLFNAQNVAKVAHKKKM